jgi:isoleucyl-tRNA synthetase
MYEILSKYRDALAELVGLSHVELSEESGMRESTPSSGRATTIISKANAPKCERCWRHVPDVGQNANYPTVCLRCAEALDAIDFPTYAAPTP